MTFWLLLVSDVKGMNFPQKIFPECPEKILFTNLFSKGLNIFKRQSSEPEINKFPSVFHCTVFTHPECPSLKITIKISFFFFEAYRACDFSIYESNFDLNRYHIQVFFFLKNFQTPLRSFVGITFLMCFDGVVQLNQ